ncbi:hypothetical protein F5884DRAFT_781388 [Xylogone sp. PMI_703]|nr:hypothetical protein F5884DRAFT_781388 [Xylogone sp. PMI_703]
MASESPSIAVDERKNAEFEERGFEKTGSTDNVSDSGPSNEPENKATDEGASFKCQYCDRTFSMNKYRSIHEDSHTRERPFKCKKCASAFQNSYLLLRHDRTSHAHDGNPLPVDFWKARNGAERA